MKYQKGTRRRALEYEKDWAMRWKQDKTFEKSVAMRPKDNSYVFYDGPPFITGVPHTGTLLVSIIKDAVPRYQTMKGKRVERVWGWDTHGLPAERYTEKKLGINSREEVLVYGIEKYILACRANMVQTGSEWEDTVD
ncbi:class I tRNA ligase family protein, partial [Candidatus Saccharibacteria bacterium]|nr:class I tRNA ligase family protein [Candidatus Saccharibacteria bacterium]